LLVELSSMRKILRLSSQKQKTGNNILHKEKCRHILLCQIRYTEIYKAFGGREFCVTNSI